MPYSWHRRNKGERSPPRSKGVAEQWCEGRYGPWITEIKTSDTKAVPLTVIGCSTAHVRFCCPRSIPRNARSTQLLHAAQETSELQIIITRTVIARKSVTGCLLAILLSARAGHCHKQEENKAAEGPGYQLACILSPGPYRKWLPNLIIQDCQFDG